MKIIPITPNVVDMDQSLINYMDKHYPHYQFPDPYLEEPINISILEFKLDYDYRIDGGYFNSVYEDYM